MVIVLLSMLPMFLIAPIILSNSSQQVVRYKSPSDGISLIYQSGNYALPHRWVGSNNTITMPNLR